ncbi:LysR substrate-binding domain-containing protein, partial [Arthrobacter sp. JCM 19049]|uniref:LysR substrate-binding domain-containing protein n=1 Tax=Arthrobacter sp. JCM 19049 TaxID=1460643 RepID=UPI0035B52961
MTIAETLLPAWLSRLRTLVPRVRVDVKVGNSEEILQQVQQGALQLGFVETPHLPQQLNTLLVQQDALRIVVGPHHPWAERSTPVSLVELAATPLVLRESGSGT